MFIRAAMRDWLIRLGIGLVCLIASCGVLLILARRLPPGCSGLCQVWVSRLT
jgi:hypothetical protein